MNRILSGAIVTSFVLLGLVACSSDDDASPQSNAGAQGAPCGGNGDCQVHFTCSTAKICARDCKTRTDCAPEQQCCDSTTSATKLECTDHAADSPVHCTGG